MGKMGIAAFTQRGRELADRLAHLMQPGWQISFYEKELKAWCGQRFQDSDAVIFIGACGIAVRTIAPFLKSKTTDPAVLVIDEAGQFVISLLSGHIGGANEFAAAVAAQIGAVPVITTASDVNGKIAVDVFARKNHLGISSMKAAKDMAAAILRGESVGVYCTGIIEGAIPPELTLLNCADPKPGAGNMSDGSGADADERRLEHEADVLANRYDSDVDRIGERRLNNNGVDVPEKGSRTEHAADAKRTPQVRHILWISEYEPDAELARKLLEEPSGTVLHLIPRSVVLGVGCRRGKPGEEVISTAEKVLQDAGISRRALALAASIDLKREEKGILELCEKYALEYVTYTAEELKNVQGTFQSSDFVRKTTGVDNVCERSALLAAGKGARLIRPKYAENGVTAALAAREWRVRFEE